MTRLMAVLGLAALVVIVALVVGAVVFGWLVVIERLRALLG